MGRSPCCDKLGLKKGPWTPEEDQKLLAYIDDHGHGNWRALPAKAGDRLFLAAFALQIGLQRCGKSCRLRWTNYLRPDIKRGKFSLQEEQTIIQLHALLGNRWSIIASHLPKRTDNEIKNYWNTHLKKRLAKMGIDPVTHKPENNALAASNGHSKNATNLSHIAQWESARLEAEARLAHQSKLRSNSLQTVELSRSSSSPAKTRHTHQPSPPPNYLDVPPACHGGGERDKATTVTEAAVSGGGCDLESSTSTLSFSENGPPPPPQLSTEGTGEGGAGMFEFMGNSEDAMVKEEGSDDEWKIFGNSTDTLPQYSDGLENSISFPSVIHDLTISMEGFAELLTSSSADRSLSNSDNGGGSGGDGGSDRGGARSDCYEDNKNYWNSILNLANSSPSNSPLL